MAERIKTQLKVNDDEWTVIQPLLEKVGDKLIGTRSGGFGGAWRLRAAIVDGGRRREGNNNAGGNQPAATDNNHGGGNQPQRREGGGGGGPRGGSPETQALRTRRWPTTTPRSTT